MARLNADQLSISQGEDAESVLSGASSLVDDGKWTLCLNGAGVERPFKFKTFNTTWEFMNRVAAECKVTRHHPEWSNVYNTTHIRWTTHNPAGLSSKDIHMAQFCDQTAQELNEQAVNPEEVRIQGSGNLIAGNCCKK